MVQAPFKVQVVGYAPKLERDTTSARPVTKVDVKRDVSDELREHFDHYPIAPDARPITVRPDSAEDMQLLLGEGVERALRAPEVNYDALEGWAWQVVVVVPLSAFLASFMTEAGKDAYKAMKRLMHRLATAAARRRGPSAPDIRTVELRDAESGLTLYLSEDLPNKAYRQLLTITLPPLSKDYSLDRLLWFRDRWILQVRVQVTHHRRIDDDAALPQQSTVLVPLVWRAADRWWSLPPEDEAGDSLFIQ
jgi:hypothetical protein